MLLLLAAEIFNINLFKKNFAYSQSDQSLCKLIEHSMTVKLLVEQHLEFLSLK